MLNNLRTRGADDPSTNGATRRSASARHGDPATEPQARMRRDYADRRRARLLARGSRYALLALVGVFAFIGVRTAILGPPAPKAASAVTAGAQVDNAAENFARDFARTYLSYGATAELRRAREEALAFFPLASGERRDFGMALPPSGRQQVIAVDLAQAGPTARPDTTNYTVQAINDRGQSLYLSVPVTRTPTGLALYDYPAFVGPPASATDAVDQRGDFVRDDALQEVVRRALRNYLNGNADDLNADLTRDAQVGLPNQPLRFISVEPLRWTSADNNVSVSATARARDEGGATYSLSYEVEVVRAAQGRWYVRAIQALPTTT